MFIGNILNTMLRLLFNFKIKLSCVSFAPHSRIFLIGGSSISTARMTVRNWTASVKFRGLELPRKCHCHRKAFRSLTQCIPNSCAPWRHVVDFFVFFWYSCFIPRLNFLVSYSSDPSRGIFNCSTATEAALVWVIDGSTSDSESLDSVRLCRLFLAFTTNTCFEMRLWKTNVIKKKRNLWMPPVPAWSEKQKKDTQ